MAANVSRRNFAKLFAVEAASRVVDRMMHGYVVDFLDFHWPFLDGLFYRGHFPAFNLADAAITAGAVGLILDELLRVRQAK